MLIKGIGFTVIGMSASGRAAAEALLRRGGRVHIYDDNRTKRVERVMAALKSKGAIVCDDLNAAIDKSQVVVLSPGVPVDTPKVVEAKRASKRVIGELELGFLLAKSPFLAVTGTNGKTTTCSLIHHVLKCAGIKSELVGNIGTPVCDRLDNLTEDVFAVTEVSSFQLETTHLFCPHVAAVLNITPDHLDRHYNMENYVYLKRRILSNMRESEIAVLNADDETVKSFKEGLRAKIVWFSLKNDADVCVKDGYFTYFGEKVARVDCLTLNGDHNKENALAAIAVLKSVGVESEAIERGFSGFKGIRHRMELIAEKNGVKYYNDSKSTNVDSTVKAVSAMTSPTVIILGGKDKNQDYTGLFEFLKKSSVVHAVIMGENRYKMLAAANDAGFMRLSLSSSFESAVKIARIEARNNGCVLLSPACASFDMFSNYEERGKEFERIVKAINV